MTVLVLCLVLMFGLPGISSVFEDPDVLPSVRRPVTINTCPWWALGSSVVCAAAVAAAMFHTIAFSFVDCDLDGGLVPLWSGLALLAAFS